MKIVFILLALISNLAFAGTSLLADNSQWKKGPTGAVASDDGRFTFLLGELKDQPEVSRPYFSGFAMWIKTNATGELTQIGLDDNGAAMKHRIDAHFVTSNGLYVSFVTDTNYETDTPGGIYVYDVEKRTQYEVSTNHVGEKYDYRSDGVQISEDGRYVVFSTASTNVIENQPTTLRSRVFRKDLETGTTIMLNALPSGAVIDNAKIRGVYRSISHDASRVSFVGTYGPYSGTIHTQIFTWNEFDGNVEHISRDSEGNVLPLASGYISMSYYGNHVVFGNKYNTYTESEGSYNTAYFKSLITGKLTNLDLLPSGNLSDSKMELSGLAGPTLNGDGTLVSYISYSTNADENYPEFRRKAFLIDMTTGQHTGISYIEDWLPQLYAARTDSARLSTSGGQVTMSGGPLYDAKLGAFLRSTPLPSCDEVLPFSIADTLVNNPPGVALSELCAQEAQLAFEPK